MLNELHCRPDTAVNAPCRPCAQSPTQMQGLQAAFVFIPTLHPLYQVGLSARHSHPFLFD
jgi:hypothetical protein